MVVLSTKDFDWDKESKTFVSEISDLPVIPVRQSIALKSHRTGKIRDFHYVFTDRDRENDIVSWRYRSNGAGVNDTFDMIIYND